MWAALRLRSDLISTLPWKPYREVGGRAIEVPKPPMLIDPSAGWLWNEWMYATQFDIDRFGNVFGFVAAVDGAGRPAQVELTDTSEWSVVGSSSSGAWEYQHKGVPQPKASVWHERQYVVPGIPLGLSPIAHAAWATGHYLSAQQFALDWFALSLPCRTRVLALRLSTRPISLADFLRPKAPPPAALVAPVWGWPLASVLWS